MGKKQVAVSLRKPPPADPNAFVSGAERGEPGIPAPIALHSVDVEADFDVIRQGNVDHGLAAQHAVIACRSLDIAFETIGRPLRDKQNGATCRVAAEQRALWPLENLGAVQIHERANGKVAS